MDKFLDHSSTLDLRSIDAGMYRFGFMGHSPDPGDSLRLVVDSGSVSIWRSSTDTWEPIKGDIDFYNSQFEEEVWLQVDSDTGAAFHFKAIDSYNYYPYDDAATNPSFDLDLPDRWFEMGDTISTAWTFGKETLYENSQTVDKSGRLSTLSLIDDLGGEDDFSDYAKFDLTADAAIHLITEGAIAEIINSSGQVVASSDDMYESDLVTALKAGTYYLHYSSEGSKPQEWTSDLSIDYFDQMQQGSRFLRPTPNPRAASFPEMDMTALIESEPFDSRYFQSGEKAHVLGIPQGTHELTYTLYTDDASDLLKVWEVHGDISYLDGDVWKQIDYSTTFSNTGGTTSLTFRVDSKIGSLKFGAVDIGDLSNPAGEIALYSSELSFDMGDDMSSAWNVFTLRPDVARSWDYGIARYTDETYICETIGGGDTTDFARFRLTEDSTIRLTSINAIAQILNAQGEVILDSGDSYMTFFQYELAAGQYFIRFYNNGTDLQEFYATLELVPEEM